MTSVRSLLARVRRVLSPPWPPEPDVSQSPVFPGHTVVQVDYSPRRHHRVVITQGGDGLLRVHHQYWDAADPEFGYSAAWVPGQTTASITDSLDRARTLARELLGAAKDWAG
jgi:hypothetical protein